MGESKSLTVAVPFVRVDASQNPNLTLQHGDDPTLPYYRAMVVAFASFRRFNPGLSLKVVSTCPPPAEVAGALVDLAVEIVLVEFSHKPPAGFTDKFEASLYLLDALEALGDRDVLLIDPDVLCVGPIDGMLSEVAGRVGAMSIDYDPDHSVHGLSRVEAGMLHGLLGEPHPAPTYFGGEVYFIPADLSPVVRNRAEVAWKLALSRHDAGQSKFVTEEHLLGYALRGAPVADLTGFVKRIWTARRFRNVDGMEQELLMWHLPAEKDRGFPALYAAAVDTASWFWTESRIVFMQRAGRAMGVKNRKVARLALDIVGQALNRVGQLHQVSVLIAAAGRRKISFTRHCGPKRMLTFGDSFVAAADHCRPGYARLLPLLMLSRGENMGRGGTGFVKASGDRRPYRSRLVDLLSRESDLVVIQSSGNDAGCDLEDVQMAARDFLTAICDRFARVVVIGPMWAIEGRENLPALRDTIGSVCGELDIQFVDALGWLAPRWIGPDGAHPTWAGHALIAWKAARAIRRSRPRQLTAVQV